MDTKQPHTSPVQEIGVLTRREIEARIVGPLLEALGKEFDQERVLEITREVIIKLAREQGEDLAKLMGGDSLTHLASGLEFWKKDDALQIEVLEQSDGCIPAM